MSESGKKPDAVIVGAGIIGATLALELASRGAQVLVQERGEALAQASSAAAGMLAANDPHNPPALSSLAVFSEGLYASFLARIEDISGQTVPFQTERTRQYRDDGSSYMLAERSIDPRQLATALRAALKNSASIVIEPPAETPPRGRILVHTTGAYGPATTPVKGQMLRVRLPDEDDTRHLPLREVHRSEDVYIVPRRFGPQAGTALIGATIEHAGFDTATHAADLSALQSRACELLPQLRGAAIVEAWAGLRPDTPDHLPLLGRAEDTGEYLATGHFRNGILLAPATAVVMADLLEGKQPAVDLTAFAADRFGTLHPRENR